MSAFGNYPPGVTDADIDRYFGPDEEEDEMERKRENALHRQEMLEAEIERESERIREDKERAALQRGSHDTTRPLAGNRLSSKECSPMQETSQRRVSRQRLAEIYRALRGERRHDDRIVTIADLEDIQFGNFGAPEMTFAEFMDIQTSVQLYDEEDGDA
jgi:hypothetical protein